MIRKLIFSLFVSFFPSFLVGQISGLVYDGKTSEALVAVNIVVVGTERGTTTDNDGHFEITGLQPGNYQLRFTYIGYEPLTKSDIIVRTGAPMRFEIALIPSILQSEELVVTAGYFTEKIASLKSVTMLSQEEIRRYPGGFEDIVRVATSLPGVATVINGGRNDLLVRGGGPSENLYLLNNMEVPNINHFGNQATAGGALSFINLDFVENVSFSTGGFGVAFGDKMSSVLEISTRHAVQRPFSGKATVSATQFGLNLESAPSPNSSILFSARKSYLDLIFKAAGFYFVPVYTDFNFFADYHFSNASTLSFFALAALDMVERNQESLENRISNAELMDNSQDRYVSGLNWKKVINRGFLSATLGVTHTDFSFSQLDENEVVYFSNDLRSKEYQAKFDYYHAFAAGPELTLGALIKKYDEDTQTTFADTIYNRSGVRVPLSVLGINPDILSGINGKSQAIYSQLEHNVGKFDFIAGVRWDHYPFLDEADYLSPRFNALYRHDVRTTLKASVGTFYQRPALSWLANPANRSLKAYRNHTAILGATRLLEDDFIVTVEGFYKKYNDLPTGTQSGLNDYIVFTNSGVGYGGREDDFQGFGFNQLVSEATGVAYGLEVQFQKKYSQSPWYGLLSFSLGKSEYTAGNGLTTPGEYDQRFIANLSMGYIFSPKWEMSSKSRLFTGAPYSPLFLPEENNGNIQRLPETYLTERLGSTFLVDVRVDRHINFNKYSMIFFLDIQNVFNTKVERKPTYDFWKKEIETRDPLGILPSIGLSLTF